MNPISLVRILVVAATSALLCAGAAAQDVTGAGATFPAPLYAKWADAYNRATGRKVNYQSIGSGAGLRQIQGRTVDFGASDMPLTDAELARHGLLQFPTVIGGVVPVVNIRGIRPGQIRLTGPVLADIYLGKITRWDAPELVELNPGVPLPNAAITVVRRADGSGTTFLFTNYLSKVNADWKRRVGEGTAVRWPVGAGGKGNEGVSAFVSRLPNSIGYVEFAYVKQSGMAHVQMRNQAGNFVQPSDAGFKAASIGADWDKTFYQVLTDQPGAESWPITGATFIMMHLKQDKPEHAAASLRFFDWAFENGDAMAAELEFVPLEPAVKERVRQEWTRIQDNGGTAVGFQ
jgi:phosphate transport system substrate-binding protein